ncbi:response regulator 2 [Prunus dulcis]|uniref:Response regulator 2 n=1 Tax=Prunus dulcis TaxID=3755 RepID=A0A4Y1RP37_PRUDU|nr:response regulator 2 [Prunus dulcis]
MASKSVLIVALLFSVLILCLQGTYADRIQGWEGGYARFYGGGDAFASGAIGGGIGNGNWDSQGYGFSSGSCYELKCDSGPIWCLTGDEEKQEKRAKRGRKRSREGDDEERTAAPRKKRCEWKKSLGEKFMLAITHIGLDNATPKRILEFMNEPDLTIKNVASHLQKYRIFLKKLKVGVAGDEDMRERLRRSSFALGHLELFFNNNERDQHHSQLLKQQQMGTSIGSTFQPSAGIGSTLSLTAAASNRHGPIQFSNDQQSSTSNSSRSIPQLIGSGQSSLLNNNPANFLRQQPTLGNRNGNQLFCQENRPAAFGMQQPSNNFENGGMSFDPMNNVGLTNNNIGTNNLMQVYPLQSQPGTNNPFSYNLATSVNQSGSNFTPMSSSFHNLGSHFNDVNQFEVDWQSSCSAGFETGASSAYQFPPNLPDNKGDLDQQQNVPVLPPPEWNFNDQCGLPNINVGGGNVENSNRGFMNNTNTVVAPPTLINNNNISHEQESVSDSDFSMLRRCLFTDEQGNYQSPSQQQDGGHDQLPYQVEVQDPAANQVPNLSADQVPNPGPYNVEDNAPNETISEPGMPTLFELEGDNTRFSYLSGKSTIRFYSNHVLTSLRNIHGMVIYVRMLIYCMVLYGMVILVAELWALYHGLKLAQRLQVTKLIVETDSTIVLHLLNAKLEPNHPLLTLLNMCRVCWKSSWDCSIFHVFREVNFAADSLAKMGYSLLCFASWWYYRCSPRRQGWPFKV